MSFRKTCGALILAAVTSVVALVGGADSAMAGSRGSAVINVGDKSTATVADGLLLFEANVKWSAVSADWAKARSGWVARVKASKTPGDVAKEVLALETAMGWGAVEDAWKKRRAGWVAELGAAKTDREVALLLIELETNTKWSAVESTWAPLRNGWIAKLKAV